MEGWELTMGVTALANGIACGLSGEELNLAAALFTLLGDALAAISAQRALCGGEPDHPEIGGQGETE